MAPKSHTILLSEEDARMFILFQKQHALINALDSLGVFDMRNGSVTIHYDSVGKIRSMEKKQQFRLDGTCE